MTAPGAKFWDRIAAKYARSPISNEDAYKKKLQYTRAHLEPDMRLLEFGCGTGSTAILHAPFVREILALDISANMLDIARQRAKEAQVTNIEFQQTTIEDFAAPAESFDVVMGMSILHLLQNRVAAVTKVFSLLRPGGVFVSSTACMGDDWVLMRYLLPVARGIGLAPYVAVFSVNELADELTAAGFQIEHQWQPAKKEAVFIIARKPAA